jgi:zinc protease
MMHPGFAAGLLAVCLLAAAPAGAAPVQELTLDNGLLVLVKPDTRAPVVVSQIWYRVGSSYEHEGVTGLSHMLEHMLFKGTPKHPAGEFSRIIAAQGGRENAFTGSDYTAYFQTLEKSRLPVALELEADRMRNALIPADEFLKERDVVAEERRLRTEDSPQALANEQLRAAAFVSSPYHHSVIGWMGDILNYSREDAFQWYQRWYSPNNAALVVVGDVEPQAVFDLAKKYFGPLPKRDITPPKPRPEIAQQGQRRVQLKIPAKLPYLAMGYKTPSLKTVENEAEAYALEALAWVLDGGDSARFSRELVRGEALAAEISTSYDLDARLDSLLSIAAVPAPGVDIIRLEAALLAQIRRLREQPVSAEELERVKSQLAAHYVYEQDSAFYQGMKLGLYQTVGLGWKRADEYLERMRSVTPEQIQAVARKYLLPERLTVVSLDPQPMDKPRPRAAAASSRH